MNNDTPGDPDGELRRRVEFIAHDLNHLATIILGYNELLLERTPGTESDRYDLEQIRRAARRVASLTRQLQDLGEAAPPSIVDVNALTADSEELIRGILGKEISLRTRFDPKLGRIEVIPEHLDRILINLAMNAAAAMPEGGEVTIATSNVEFDEGGPHVQIQFTDNGPGMDPQAISSSGLGLSIVKEMVSQAGGTIDIRSAPAQGTTITIRFPRIAEFVQPSSEGSRRTVLVADDDPPMRELIRVTLEGAGLEVLEADNGEQATAMLAQRGVDLILVDILMPQMDGLETIRLARKYYRNVKTVAMSGAREDYLEVARLLGANAVIGKPFTREFLVETVRGLLA